MSSSHIVVIGAGLAGLSAALRLCEHNATMTVTLLEAQERVGGRVLSVSINDTLTEMGATWFHGTRDNAAYNLAKSFGLVPEEDQQRLAHYEEQAGSDDDQLEGKDLFDHETVFISSGPGSERTDRRCIVDKQLILPVVKLYAKTIKQLSKGLVNAVELNGISVRKHIQRQMIEHMGIDISSSTRAVEQQKQRTQLRLETNEDEDDHWYDYETRCTLAAVHARDLMECAVNGCDSTDEVSAELLETYGELKGDNVKMPRNQGMSSLIEALHERVRVAGVKVSLSSEVTRIKQWDGGDGKVQVTVRTEGETRKIQANAVIWTPSLNVLKDACKREIFDPPLPNVFQQSLGRRLQQQVEQVYVCLSYRSKCAFSDKHDGTMVPVLWDLGNDEARQHWKYGVFGMLYDFHSATVSFWLCGRHAQLFCALTSSERASQAKHVISSVYNINVGHIAIDHVMCSDWSGNKFIRGSYSFPGVGGHVHDVDVIAGKVEGRGRLYFAGEATHPQFYSTMHGAIESGDREAGRVEQDLGLACGKSVRNDE